MAFWGRAFSALFFPIFRTVWGGMDYRNKSGNDALGL